MMYGKKLRDLLVAGQVGFALTIGVLLSVDGQPAIAQQILVVGNDRGGMIGERAKAIERLRAAQARVEIRGDLCYSACTMYLGVADVCVSPTTTFGFHGPSRNGRSLPPNEFDHWSRVMARYYPEALRLWYLQTGRYAQAQPMRISGQQIIEMGYQPCAG